MAGEEGEMVTRVRVPNKKEREVLGTVTSMLGASRVVVRCVDGVTRVCRIPGKLKKRIWIREGDVVIVVPWEFQNEKGDVVWRYTGPQVNWLERKGFL
ncbi:translation initiation factor eIF-1A [Methanocella conradii]|uniref:translation initiation factor eIF-1A n=1 Tax=Methanocella conradii TaxID=1175444 RepID=UPI00157D8C57|nr:translation initiation factor eIF-1A [Methanocella conradii]